ncbi:hypothetical protein PAECIP111893_02758 [Paenibacillus plantiphilus]|uniref:SLH domain-containing protein n=2 Tax=Paenibacillus plantiphilus TaxID=2905650 RepID=A0ABN8GJ35_9BACL|nr:hypothetical protein PAECIP111893_02758 [Paenibacillus plantiphilus]
MDGTFQPDQPITRAEALSVIDRLASLYEEDKAFHITADNIDFEEIAMKSTDHPIVSITSPTVGNKHAMNSNSLTLNNCLLHLLHHQARSTERQISLKFGEQHPTSGSSSDHIHESIRRNADRKHCGRAS